MNLTQQLEYLRKKGCGHKDNAICGQNYPKGQFINFEGLYLCERCQAKITILEQAIAEMQKQRQEILDKIEKIGKIWEIAEENDIGEFEYSQFKDTAIYKEILKEINQPKTEDNNKICPICKTLTIFDIKTNQWTCPRRCKKENSKQ